MKLDAAHAVAQIDQRSAGIFLDHAVGFLRHLHRPHACRNLHRLILRSPQIKISPARGSFGIVQVPGFLAAGEQFLDIGRDRAAFFLHARDGGLDAGRVPEFKRTQLPVEAQPHGAIDLDDGVGNFGNAVGGVSPQIGQSRPQERAGFVALLRAALEPQQHAQPRARIFDVLRHVERRELWLS